MDIQRLADNRTPMAVRCLPVSDRNGRDVALIVARMTYAVSAAGAVSAVLFGSPIRFEDVPNTGERWSSLRFPNDLADEKPGTDVILLGTAYPPADRVVTEHDVSLRVEVPASAARLPRTLRRSVRVFGPRVFYAGALGVIPGPAAALGPTPLVYELAYGGVDAADPARPVIERRNPAGIGFAVDRATLVGTRAPSIEDPAHLLAGGRLSMTGSPGAGPRPAGFGPIPAQWSPRAPRAGTHDDVWRRERAPVRPVDFDPRHHVFADPELWSEVPLAGDEPVEILGATREGAWRFRLPRYQPVFEVVRKDGTSIERPHLDTFLVDADAGRVELTFRLAVPLPRKSAHLHVVRVLEAEPLPERIGVVV